MMEKSIKKVDDKTLAKIAGGLDTPLPIDDVFDIIKENSPYHYIKNKILEHTQKNTKN